MRNDLSNFMDNVDKMGTSVDTLFGNTPPVELEEREFELLSVPSHIDSEDNDANFDYVYSRAILYSLVNKAGTNLEMATQLAKINQDPKSYQVANDIMSTMMQMIKLLNSNHKLHREVNTMEDLSKDSGKKTTNNNIKFKGSLSSLKLALEEGKISK